MFILSELTDLVSIPPSSFSIPNHLAITDELHKKYANKVISNLGLAISVWDILDIKDGMLKPGEGAAFVETKFRLVVWKPFVGEVLTGWVSENSSEGIKVKLDFFDEIWIPKHYLFEDCTFKPAENAWVWQTDEVTELFIDVDDKIRFRIEEELFVNVKPKSSSEASGLDEPKNKAPSYALLASCQTEGMGCISWWE